MDISEAYSAYHEAHKRLLLLDYDGTLVGFNNDPSAAKPTKEVLDILKKLADDPCNTIVIVSGRDHRTLEEWLGHLPLSFGAEHGLLYKEPGKPWQASVHIDTAWKNEVRKIMEPYAAELPGAFIEEKTSALAWHCRAVADRQRAIAASDQLIAKLTEQAAYQKLRVMHGNNVVEVQPAGYSKGTAAGHWLEQNDNDFILAAGDDTTDEDLFRAAPKSAFTIKVGNEKTAARLRLSSPAALLNLLDSLS